MVWGMIGAAAIGAVSSALGQRSANKATAASTDKQLQFQKESAQNSYLWATQDMKRAGINPMLAYQRGGASALSGASYNAQNVMGGATRDAVSAAVTALAAKRQKTEITNIKADTKKKDQEYQVLYGESIKKSKEVGLLEQQINSARAAAKRDKVAEEFYKTDFGKKMRQIELFMQSIGGGVSSAGSAARTGAILRREKND